MLLKHILADGNVQHRHKAHLDGPLTSVQLFTVEAKHAHALALNTTRDPNLNLEGNFSWNAFKRQTSRKIISINILTFPPTLTFTHMYIY